jgi:1,4-dihydroxy-2-naphthoate polyprenyltransferase
VRSRREIWIHLLLYPGHTLPTAAAPILIGVGLAIHDGVFALWPALIAFLCSWMVHCGGVFVDQYELLARYPTIREHPELNDAVAAGSLRLPMLRGLALAWFVLALVPGIYLLRVIGAPAIGLGIIGIVAASWYAAGPRTMAQLGLADPIFFVMFGVIAVAATYFVQAQALPASALLVGLPSAALVTNVLVIDDMRDIEFDRAKGWRTTAVRHGLRGSRLEHLALTCAAYAGTLALAVRYGGWLLLPLLTLPAALLAERAVWTAAHREVLIPWTPRSAFIALVHSALIALGLALA